MRYNVYCDESCHLPNDGNKIMVLGGIWCPKSQVRRINEDIRSIKRKYSIGTEMKWVKVSEAKKGAYLELINYFFDMVILEDRGTHFKLITAYNVLPYKVKSYEKDYKKYGQTKTPI